MATNFVVGGTASVMGVSSLASSVTVGGGYSSTGVTITAAGTLHAKGDLLVAGTSTLRQSVSIGRDNITLSDDGSITTKNNLVVDGFSTLAGEVTIGGGYASTGPVTNGSESCLAS